MKIGINGHVGRVIASYTGRMVALIEVVPDPTIQGVFGVRVVTLPKVIKTGTEPPQENFFLIKEVPLHKITEDDLEEVEFIEWPPITS